VVRRLRERLIAEALTVVKVGVMVGVTLHRHTDVRCGAGGVGRCVRCAGRAIRCWMGCSIGTAGCDVGTCRGVERGPCCGVVEVWNRAATWAEAWREDHAAVDRGAERTALRCGQRRGERTVLQLTEPRRGPCCSGLVGFRLGVEF
jgi:hypothetical protein